MSYSFTVASNQYLWCASPANLSSPPLTMSCWFKRPGTGSVAALMSLANESAINDRFFLFLGSSNTLGMQTYTASAVAAGVTTATASTGVWNHAAGVVASTGSRTAYLNGTAGTANTTGISNPTLTATSIAARKNSTVAGYSTIEIADVGIWNVELTSAEITSLSKGMSCQHIRPQSLVFYAPLIRELIDPKGGKTLTNVNSTTVSAHPRIYY